MRSARRGNLSGARERRVAQSTGSGAMRMTTNRSAIPLDRIEAAAALVHAAVQPTPQICWPLLSERCGTEVWVKHENHTPIGAFQIRGGLIYMDELVRRRPDELGRASCRERVCPSVEVSVVAVALKKHINHYTR